MPSSLRLSHSVINFLHQPCATKVSQRKEPALLSAQSQLDILLRTQAGGPWANSWQVAGEGIRAGGRKGDQC